MTSTVPFSTPQVYNHLSCPVICPEKKQKANNLQHIIDNTNEFSIFACILKRSGIDLFDDDYNYTLFVPTNKCLDGLDLKCIDRSTARRIVLSSTLQEKIPSEIFLSTPFAYYSTLNPVQSLLISSDCDQIYINANSPCCIKVVQGDIISCNGIIHVTNGLITPYVI